MHVYAVFEDMSDVYGAEFNGLIDLYVNAEDAYARCEAHNKTLKNPEYRKWYVQRQELLVGIRAKEKENDDGR